VEGFESGCAISERKEAFWLHQGSAESRRTPRLLKRISRVPQPVLG